MTWGMRDKKLISFVLFPLNINQNRNWPTNAPQGGGDMASVTNIGAGVEFDTV